MPQNGVGVDALSPKQRQLCNKSIEQPVKSKECLLATTYVSTHDNNRTWQETGLRTSILVSQFSCGVLVSVQGFQPERKMVPKDGCDKKQ